MPLQNRVAPDGSLHAVSARGMFMGNRGILHDHETKLLTRKRWTHQAWVTCLLEFKGRKRSLFGKGTYTELFFLDEVTALAAGHRPCYECRRNDARRYREALSQSGKFDGLDATALNRLLHSERALSAKRDFKSLSSGDLVDLPSGAIVKQGDVFHAKRNRNWLRWGFSGYESSLGPLEPEETVLITPETTIIALANGYHAAWHESALSAQHAKSP